MYVTMAQALGWDGAVGFPRRDDIGTSPDGYRERDWFPTGGPAPAVTEKARSWMLRFGDTGSSWAWERPDTTIVGSFRPDIVAAPGYRKKGDPSRRNAPGSIRVTLEEAAVPQSFPPEYPWQGSRTAKFRQIGNAVPPLWATKLLEHVIKD